MNKNKIINDILKEAYTRTVRVHIKDEEDDASKEFTLAEKYLKEIFDEIEIRLTDESFSHEFGTEHGYGTEVIGMSWTNKLRIILTIDKVKDINAYIKDVLPYFLTDVEEKHGKPIKSKKTEFERTPYWMPSKVETDFVLNIDIKRKLNDNTYILEVYWEES